MSEVAFKFYCGNCLNIVNPSSGVVLSCGDFLCGKCETLKENNCPSCHARDIRSATLHDPPFEVKQMLSDPASQLESLFNILKFQVKHYQQMLSRAGVIISTMSDTIDQYKKREENMNEDKVNNVMSSIHRSSTEDQSIPKETSQNLKAKLLWKSGTKATPVYTTPVKNDLDAISPRQESISRNDPYLMGAGRPNKFGYESASRDVQSGNSYSIPPKTPETSYSTSINDFKKRKLQSESSFNRNDSSSPNPSIKKYDTPNSLYAPAGKGSIDRATSNQKTPSLSSGAIRSPYLPYIRSAGKIATLSQRNLDSYRMPRGTNSQGNSYNTPGGTNSSSGSSYHYSNSNGSYYYRNDNGSTYYNPGSSGAGSVTYTPSSSSGSGASSGSSRGR